MRKNKFATFFNDILCRIYIIGNSVEGECVFFVLLGDNEIIYSCIVDSFVYNNKLAIDLVKDIINVNQVTDLFWSHPHDDHSAGFIDLIDKFKPSHVFIPAELQNLPEGFANISKEVLQKINTYPSYDRRYLNQPQIEGIGTNYLVLEETLRVNNISIPFSIFTVAPCAGKIRRNAITQNFNSLNDYSIVTSIVLGDFSLLLTGDIQDKMIHYLQDRICRDIPYPNILKIPHHGSNHSLQITSLFEEDSKINIAIATSKKSSKLPTQKALEHYKKFCNQLYKINPNSTDISIWGAEVDILHATITEIVNKNFLNLI